MGVPPYPAMTIAKWFIALAQAEEEELCNLKLQKLLCRAQRHHLARHGRSLFMQEIQASPEGPVVPEVYHAFEAFGASSIELGDDDAFTWPDVDPATANFLGEVWNAYGGHCADMRLAFPAARRHLLGAAAGRGQVPVGGAA